jgi:hypothetical protein
MALRIRDEYLSLDDDPPLKCIDYTCDEVRKLLLAWKLDWKKRNGDIPNDIMFDRYFNDVEDYLSKCKCEKNEQT